MKQFNNYADAKKAAESRGGAKLPAGAYVCKIIKVKYENGENGKSDKIAVMFDIAEGEQKGFFQKQYEENTSDDKKWKGIIRLYVPTDDGSDSDAMTKRTFAGLTSSLEHSISGYSWDWDENKWANKSIGIVFGETGTKIDGKEIVFTEARFGVDADKVRDGSAPVAKFKSKNGYGEGGGSSSSSGFMSIPDNNLSEIPFD